MYVIGVNLYATLSTRLVGNHLLKNLIWSTQIPKEIWNRIWEASLDWHMSSQTILALLYSHISTAITIV